MQDPLALPYALAIERFCSRGSGADLYHLKSEERTAAPVLRRDQLATLKIPVGEKKFNDLDFERKPQPV